MTQQQNNKRTLKNKHTYQNETLPNRKDFVVSFITGALVGSALGLYFKNKVYQKADDLKIKEQEISKIVKERKAQLEETVEYTKERVEGFLNKSKDEKATLKAQQAAIKEEASANNLSDTSQEAQEIQEAKNEVNEAGEVETQAERLANAAKKKQAKLTKDSKESQLTEALFAEKPVAKNDLKEIPQLVTKKKVAKAHTSVKSSNVSDNKHNVKQKDATFENGVITRNANDKKTNNTTVGKQPAQQSKTNNTTASDKQTKQTTPSNKRNASKASTNKTSSQKKQNNKKTTQSAKNKNTANQSTKQSNKSSNKKSKTTNAKSTSSAKSPKAKVEPAKSKIEKRTFND